MQRDKRVVELIEAARQLGISYHRALQWVLTRKLKGTRDPQRRRWSVDAADLERVLRARARATHERAQV